MHEDICLTNSVTTHTILKDRRYFSQIKMGETYVTTISNSIRLIKVSRRAIIILQEGIGLIINNALLFFNSQRNLLSFKDIHYNG